MIRTEEALYEGLTELGFECVKPEGAFYLFVKSPTEDENIFCETAKKHNILIVGAVQEQTKLRLTLAIRN